MTPVDNPFRAVEFPPPMLHEGVRVRVRVKDEKSLIEGTLRSADERGMRIEVPRPRPVESLAVLLGSRGALIEEEVAPDVEQPLMRRVPWQLVEAVWTRGRAVLAGLAWGTTLAVALGSCGNALDHLTDGFPKAELVYYGTGIGVLVGLLILRFGREWHRLPLPRAEFDD